MADEAHVAGAISRTGRQLVAEAPIADRARVAVRARRAGLLRVAHVAHAVPVAVELVAVGNAAAVIAAIKDAVVVVVRIADIANAVGLIVGLRLVRYQRAVVARVEHQVVVVIGVAGIALPVAIRRCLIPVRNLRAVVPRIQNTIAVAVVGAGVAHPVPVGVGLVCVGDQRAVVSAVRNRIAVDVIVTGVANTVAIHIGLVAVGHRHAVVIAVRHGIAVGVWLARCHLHSYGGAAARQQVGLTHHLHAQRCRALEQRHIVENEPRRGRLEPNLIARRKRQRSQRAGRQPRHLHGHIDLHAVEVRVEVIRRSEVQPLGREEEGHIAATRRWRSTGALRAATVGTVRRRPPRNLHIHLGEGGPAAAIGALGRHQALLGYREGILPARRGRRVVHTVALVILCIHKVGHAAANRLPRNLCAVATLRHLPHLQLARSRSVDGVMKLHTRYRAVVRREGLNHIRARNIGGIADERRIAQRQKVRLAAT